MAEDRLARVRGLLDAVRGEGRTALTAPEGKVLADAYGIAVPGEELARDVDEAVACAARFGGPVVMKIVSPDILHKTDAGGVVVGVEGAADVRAAFCRIVDNARAYDASARIEGVQIQELLPQGQEVIVGAVTDPTFGKVVAFGLGGVLVEVLKDVTFRLAPVDADEALSMLDSIRAAEVLRGVRGQAGVDRWAVAEQIRRVSELVADFPEIAEVDLNPVIATPEGAVAADIRVILATDTPKERRRYTREEILTSMRRLMQPASVAVIGASGEPGKIGNSVMRNLVDGGFAGEIHPVNPKADDILGRKAYKSVTDVPGEVDVAVFAIPARFVAAALEEVGRKRIPNAVLIPSGFAETGEQALQDEIVAVAERHGVRLLGPNIYGYYSTWQDLCATFCTPYDVKGGVALTSQSGGIGMAILGFARTTKTGVSAIVGLGNKSDLDEDDLLTWFGEDPHTECIAMHLEDLKDGRAFVEAARATVPRKPVVVLKAGRTAAGAKAAGSHTGALAGDDAVYDDILRQAGVIRAPGLNEMLEYARVARAARPRGRQRGHHHRRRRQRCAALRRGDGQRAVADGDSARPGQGVPRLHPAVRRGRQPGGHHRGRAAVDVRGDDPARSGGPAHPRARPRLLAHHRHASHGVRRTHRARGGGVPRTRRREARGGLPGGRRGGGGGVPVPLRARRRGVSVHDREAGGGAGREVPVGAGRGLVGRRFMT